MSILSLPSGAFAPATTLSAATQRATTSLRGNYTTRAALQNSLKDLDAAITSAVALKEIINAHLTARTEDAD